MQQRIETLEGKAQPGGPRGMPGLKPKADRKPAQPRGPKRPRRHGFSRQRMTPTRRVEHALDSCPECGSGLAGGWAQRTREVIDIPAVAAQATEHVFIARICPLCEQRRTPRAGLASVALGKQRLGINLVSLIAALREEARLPYRTIQWYLQTVHQLSLSVGTLVGVIRRVARQAQGELGSIRERIRGSPVVHADETGWRENGVNGYVWTFSTPTERYFLRRGRNKEVVDEALGEDFAGALVSDFYAAYHHYDGPKQRCWAHLLREIHDLRTLYSRDKQLAQWADAVHRIYRQATLQSHFQPHLQPHLGETTARRPTGLGKTSAGPLPSLPGTRWQSKASCAGALTSTSRNSSSSWPNRKWDNNAAERSLGDQPQDQRRHPLEPGHRRQDDPDLPVRHLAGPGPKSPHRLPPTTHFPSTLNSYQEM